MGIVYRALDPRLGREVVVKLLRAPSEHGRKRLQREARAMARFVHANVVPLLDVGDHEGHPYLVLPLLEGKSLEHRLRQGGPLPLDEALKIAGHVGEALYGAHELGLIHRDVKPANVLLDPRGNALLTDFGLVKDIGPSRDHTISLSVHGGALGTPGYWPPEQALGRIEDVGPPADVYALGALLYAMLLGRPPRGQELPQTASTWDTPLPSMRAEREEIPPELEELVRGCLESTTQQRPGLAHVLQELESLRLALARRGAAPAWLFPTLGALTVGACLLAFAVWTLTQGDRAQPSTASTAPVEAPPEPSPPKEPAGPRPETPPEPPPRETPSDPLTEPPAGMPLAQRQLRSAEAVQAGQTLLQSGSPERAATTFSEAIRLDPQNIAAYMGRGLARKELLQLDGAAEDLTRVLELEPAFTEANKGLTQQLGLSPSVRHDALLLRAEVRERQARHTAALEDLEAALEAKPDSLDARYQRGVVYTKLERFADAVEEITAAVKQRPHIVKGRVARAKAYAGLGDYRRALEDYSAALRSEDLGETRRRELRRERAAVFARFPDADARLEEARARARDADAAAAAKRYDDAIRDYDAAIERAPLLPEPYFGRAAARRELGQLKQALADYDAGLELDPERPLAYVERAQLKRELKRPSEALEDVDAALELRSGLAEAYLARGLALLDLQRDPAALEALTRAIELDPSSAWALVNRGACNENLQRYAEALADYERALTIGLADDVAEKVRAARADVARKLAE